MKHFGEPTVRVELPDLGAGRAACERMFVALVTLNLLAPSKS